MHDFKDFAFKSHVIIVWRQARVILSSVVLKSPPLHTFMTERLIQWELYWHLGFENWRKQFSRKEGGRPLPVCARPLPGWHVHTQGSDVGGVQGQRWRGPAGCVFVTNVWKRSTFFPLVSFLSCFLLSPSSFILPSFLACFAVLLSSPSPVFPRRFPSQTPSFYHSRHQHLLFLPQLHISWFSSVRVFHGVHSSCFQWTICP